MSFRRPSDPPPDAPGVDTGMTLIELLVSVMVIGGIAIVMTTAISVTFRTQPASQARVDVARWEQALALWLPNDIASVTSRADIGDDQSFQPCADAKCQFGVNALSLGWDDTVVSYRYGPSGDGDWQLVRVKCTAGSCATNVVLRELSPPTADDGSEIAWSSGMTLPDDVLDRVINVTAPLDVGGSDPDDPDGVDVLNVTTATRLVVSVNGFPDEDGVDRSSSVSLTAGGASRGSLEPTVFSGPEFTQASSGCGGPVTLIVDDSGSIGNDIDEVRDGVRQFVKAFDGTPTRLQIVRFDTVATVLGAGSAWNRFYDLSDPAQVELLIGANGSSGEISNITDGGLTNWEDALHRTFYAQDGQTYQDLGSPNAPAPELVVFFTDGLPTRDRVESRSTPSSAAATVDVPSRFDLPGNPFSPRGWYRADAILDQFHGQHGFRIIGLGVGSNFGYSWKQNTSGWPKTYIPVKTFLGTLIAGGDPSAYSSSAPPGYASVEYDASAGSWGDLSGADMLTASDYTNFASGLQQIALDECGGTLTVQTRDASGQPADASVTYTVGSQEVTTSRLQKSGTFEIEVSEAATTTVELIPQALTGTGYTATGWACRAGGEALTAGSDYEWITPGAPLDGVRVDVAGNAALSCTMSVSP